MKRFGILSRCLLPVITLFGLLLSSCAPAPPPAELTTITFACWDYQRSVYEPLVADFQKSNPEIGVQLVSVEEALGSTQQGNVAVVSSDDFGRVASVADTFAWFSSLLPSDWTYVLNLQPLVDQDPAFPLDDFYPGTLDDLRWQGNLHGLPAEVQPIVVFYDRGIFDANGWKYPQAGWTWGDLLEAADLATQREDGETTRYGLVVPYQFSRDIVLAILKQRGISLWDPDDPSSPSLNRPEVADILRFYTNWALVDQIMPAPISELNQENEGLIREGNAALWVDFASAHASRPEVGLVPFPEDLTVANPRIMYAFFISAATAQPEAAWRWLQYLSEHYQNPLEGILPGRRSLAEQAMQSWNIDADKQTAILYALEHPPFTANFLYGVLNNALFDVLAGNSSIEGALETAQEQALARQQELAQTPSVRSVQVPPPPATLPAAPVEEATNATFAPYYGFERPLYQALADEFNENHLDTRVDLVPAPTNFGPEMELPDCFASVWPIGDPGARQLVRSLDPFLEGGFDFNPDDFYPALLASQRYDGQLWGIPYEADTLFVYYNRSLLDQAGIDPPEPDWVITDFLDIAASLSANTGRYGFTTPRGDYGDLRFALQWLGAQLVDKGQTPAQVTFDDPSVAAAMTRYAAIAGVQNLTPGTPSTKSGWPDAFVSGLHPTGVESGQVGLWIDYIGNHALAPQLSFPNGVAPLPAQSVDQSTGTEKRNEFMVQAFYISARSSAPQICWDWIRFLSERAELVKLLPARRSVAAASEWQNRVAPDALPAYLATLEYDHMPIFFPDPDALWLPYSDPWLAEAFQEVLDGNDAKLALSGAQQKAAAFLECFQKLDGYWDTKAILSCARQADSNYPLR